jgi:ribulose-5-phosphate 4-epimerase/fuculose-1-phosphate aldolase
MIQKIRFHTHSTNAAAAAAAAATTTTTTTTTTTFFTRYAGRVNDRNTAVMIAPLMKTGSNGIVLIGL